VYLQKQENKIYLGMLTVSPDIQAKGVGKKLLKAAEEYAFVQECRAITMTVISLRKELINWYERRGYKATGDRKPFPNDPRFGVQKQPLEFIVMEKNLE
jgi:ribosomal protein S18 acetylase RimI-like enzyme